VRFLASSHRIDQLVPRTRILLALLAVGLLGQLVTGSILQGMGGGWQPEGIATYYRGSPAGQVALEGDPMAAFGALGGSVETSPGGELVMARSLGTLVEVAHFHLFAMPLAVFLAAHLFAMCPWGRTRWGGAIGYLTFAAALLDIVTPFLVRYHAAGWSWIKLLAFFGLVGGQACMLLTVAGVTLASLRRKPAQ
jgi:hypothetical protein